MRLWQKYFLRLRRRRLLLRAIRKRRDLTPVSVRTGQIAPDAILLVATMRNERIRLPYFLQYYRKLGIGHFLIVDNASDDGTSDYLAAQADVSVWSTAAAYQSSRYGADWLNWLLFRHGHGHWTLTVDADEFFIYPFCDTRPIRALTDWLETNGARSFPAMLIDMYPKGPVGDALYAEGQNPFDIADGFDAGNYLVSRNHLYGNLWIQGGPRARAFFADDPENAPSLNKIPLVRWDRSYVYVNSTHMLLPRGLNQTFAQHGGEKASGCLLHAKFLATFDAKVQEEMARRQHFGSSREYRAYAEGDPAGADLWCRWSERYINWRQLEILGLMSKGHWA